MRTLAALALCLSAPALAADVIIQNFAFNPSDLTVTAGTTVRWTNMDSSEHTATSQTGPGTLIPSGVFDSGLLSPSQFYEFTFSTPGTFYYYCRCLLHGLYTGNYLCRYFLPNSNHTRRWRLHRFWCYCYPCT